MDVQKHSKDNSERRTVVIILNASLVNGEIHQKLEANPFYRVRVSQSTEKNTIIFPGKSLAFMVIAITEMTNTWPPSREKFLNEDVIKRIEKFYTIHRNCYLLLLTRMTTDIEFNVLREIQKRFWNSPLIFYPISGAKQCLRILEQASNSKTNGQNTNEHWNIQRGHLPEEIAQNILEKNLGVTKHHDLMERSPLSRDVAKKVELFFEKDCAYV